MKKITTCFLGVLAFVQLGTHGARAWDYAAHRVVNQLALAVLPANFPAFVKTPEARERIAFLAGEPDRWRNTADLALKHINGPDHYLDMEELPVYGLAPAALPPLRYDFVAKLAAARAAHPEKFPAIDPAANADHTRELIGFLPWTISESYSKLKSEFSYLKAFEEGGTPEEIANAQANIIYTMGVMGHYVGDASQPLHTTIHHNGWVGENTNLFTTKKSFHAWIDGGYFAKIGGVFAKDLTGKLHPAQGVSFNGRPATPEEIFPAVVVFLEGENKLVAPLYQLDKDGKLSGEGEVGMQGKAFLEERLVNSGQLLGDIWYSAWQQATPDTYLKRELERRKATAAAEKQP